MAIYHWKGISQGEQQEGDIEAANQQQASEMLVKQGIIVSNLIYVGGEESAAVSSSKAALPVVQNENAEHHDDEDYHTKFKIKNVSKKELVVFSKKLATMIEAGLPIMKTLQMLRSQAENPNMKNIVHCIYKDVESGSTLSEAFQHFPTVFDTIYINLLKAGETSGRLTFFLKKLVIQIEKEEKIRAKVKSALMYPMILTIVAIVVIAIMMVKVVPVFAQMFGSMGGELPGPTRVIIMMSDFLRNPAEGGAIAVIAFATIVSLKYSIRKSIAVRRKKDKVMLKLPLLGDIVQKSTLSKIAMIEGNLSAAGVAILESLDIVSKSVVNELYRDAFIDIKRGIASGKTLSSLYAANEKLFPPTFSQMLAVGEETGNMDDMFEAVASYYEEELDLLVDRLTEMLEPIMIVFMGLTVGFIIVAMYMPIFQIGKMVSGA